MSETIEQSHSDTYAVTVGTSARVIVAGSGNAQAGTAVGSAQGTIEVPRQVTVHNAHGSQVLYLGWGSDVTTSNGVPVAAGGYRQFALTSTDELWAVASGSGTDTRVFVLHGKGRKAFSPLDLSPTLWLDASDESSIQESSGSVSQWNDLSGNGYHLAQATGANQPKTGTATMNSLNVIEYDTTSGQQFLKNASVPTTTDFTVFAVYEINALDTVYVGISGDSFGEYMYAADSASTSTTLHQNATATSMYVNNTEFTGTKRSDVYNAIGNSPAIVRITGRFATTGGLAMGYSQTAGVGTFDNGTKVAEVIVVPSPTASDISDTETYLADKWGITL